jgi:hypothetical protein
VSRGAILLALTLVLVGCAAPTDSGSSSGVPRARCLGDSRREASSDPMRPLFFLFCVESP